MESLLEAIGRTPIVPLKRITPSGGAQIFAKLERFNPGGSLKDRIIARIVAHDEKTGKLKAGQPIVAGTTGNSGIAIAILGAIKKHNVILMMPENFSLERQRMLEGLGATVLRTPLRDGMKGALSCARERAEKEEAYYLSQFDNAATIRAHRETTAAEIESVLDVPIHAFVATVGTGGTLMGVGGYFKGKGAKLVAVEPAASPMLSRGRFGDHNLQGMGPNFYPPLVDKNLIDEIISVTDEEAYKATEELARAEGILAGPTSGAALVAARRIAKELGAGKTVVTLFPDGGERYISVVRQRT